MKNIPVEKRAEKLRAYGGKANDDVHEPIKILVTKKSDTKKLKISLRKRSTKWALQNNVNEAGRIVMPKQ